MVRQNSTLLLASLFFSGLLAVTATAADPPQENLASDSNSSIINLFNGQNLDGWYTWLVDTKYEDPRNVFSIVNRQLRISGDGFGYLATREEYRNYQVVVEYRWGQRNYGSRRGKARDSGLFLHGTGPDGNSADGNGAFMMAVECQIMEAAVGDLMLIRSRDNRQIPVSLTSTISNMRDADGWPYFSPSGTPWSREQWGRLNRLRKRHDWHDTFGVEDTSRIEKPPDSWNRLECRCLEDTIRVTLNGQVINSAHRVRPPEGKILLQCEGSEILFRKVELASISGLTERRNAD